MHNAILSIPLENVPVSVIVLCYVWRQWLGGRRIRHFIPLEDVLASVIVYVLSRHNDRVGEGYDRNNGITILLSWSNLFNYRELYLGIFTV